MIPLQPHDLDLATAAALIAGRDLSPVELTDAVLDRIATAGPALDAFAVVLDADARATARECEHEIARDGPRGPLHGVPITVKDLYDIAGVPTLAGSRVRDGRVAAEDGEVVRRLRAAGAVLVAKTRTHEFAYGTTTPPVRNPWNLDRVPGGSSGGAGAAVAARMGPAGLGTDTGGSIRIPAALCGVSGLKPTYGRVSRRGVVPLAWSQDHCGPLARTALDAALVLDAIAGYDPHDPGSVDVPVPGHTEGLTGDLSGMVLGVPVNHFFDACDPEIEAAVRAAIGVLAERGARIREVTLPLAERTAVVGTRVIGAEAAAYHRRALAERPDAFGEEVRLKLEGGVLMPAVDYLDTLCTRAAARDAWRTAFDGLHAVLAPTLPAPAADFGSSTVRFGDGHTETADNAYCRLSFPADVTGLPSLSVPCGFTGDGMPIGMQIMGRLFGEPTIVRIGHAYQQATDWLRTPPEPAL